MFRGFVAAMVRAFMLLGLIATVALSQSVEYRDESSGSVSVAGRYGFAGNGRMGESRKHPDLRLHGKAT
jgi:hypothetical protein